MSDRYGYDPYGHATYTSGSVANPWGFAGGYTDSTGLIKFGTRYYDSGTGRWTQTDAEGESITSPATLNPYIYASCNSVNATDPTGLFNVWHWRCWAALGKMVGILWGMFRTTPWWLRVLILPAIAAAGTGDIPVVIAYSVMVAGLLFYLLAMGWAAIRVYQDIYTSETC